MEKNRDDKRSLATMICCISGIVTSISMITMTRKSWAIIVWSVVGVVEFILLGITLMQKYGKLK